MMIKIYFRRTGFMKKYLLYASIAVIAIMVVVLVKTWMKEGDVKLEKIKEIEMDKTFNGDYWHMVDENRIEYLKLYNLSQDDFDLTSYNIVISEGREIIKMRYKREKTFPFRLTKYTKTVLGSELHSNKIFIYKVDKKNKVYLDERGLNIDIKIEK